MVTGVAMMLGLCAVTLQLLMQLNADGQARLRAAVASSGWRGSFATTPTASRSAQLAADDKAPAKPPRSASDARARSLG